MVTVFFFLSLVFFLVFVLGSFFLNALRKFDPSPTKIAVKRFGKFVTKTIEIKDHYERAREEKDRVVLEDGGYKFLPFFPFWYDAVVVDGSDHNYPDKVIGLRTFRKIIPGVDDADRVGTDFAIPYEVTWYVDPERADKFFQSCQLGDAKKTTEEHFKRVQAILHGRITEQLIRVSSNQDDPTSESERITWEDFYENVVKITESLIRSLVEAEDDLPLKEEPDSEKREREGKALTIAHKVRSGNGKLRLAGLGICLKRLNLQEPELPEDISVAVRQKEKELRERTAEEIEVNFAIESIKKIAKETNLSPEAATNLFQSERGKATRNIHTIEGGAVPLLTIPGGPGKKEG